MQIRVSMRSNRGEIRSAISLLLCLILTPLAYGQSRRFSNGNRLSIQPNTTVRVENPGGDIQVNLGKRFDLELIVKRHNSSGQVVNSEEYQIEQNGNQVKILVRPNSDLGSLDIRLSLPEG